MNTSFQKDKIKILLYHVTIVTANETKRHNLIQLKGTKNDMVDPSKITTINLIK